ncbi:MAG: hypothetical protein RSD23_01850 [Ruthenibacterium sp.]
MSKSKDEILKATHSGEVFDWIQENPDLLDKDVGDYFNKLCKQEYLDWCKQQGVDPDGHWDIRPTKIK